MICVGDNKTMARTGAMIHKRCYDRALKTLGIERHNIESSCGWHEAKFYVLPWVKHETPPKVGDNIVNTYGEKYDVRYVKNHFVVLEEAKNK